MTKTDDQLLEAVRAGDRGATGALLERHQARVFRFGLKMCRDEEDAKEILQDTLLSAARGLRDFRGASSVSTWLYTIARSFCIKRRRTSKFAPDELVSLEDHAEAAGEIADAGRGPEEDVAGRQLRSVLDDAIGALEPMYREVLVLRDVEGLSAAEVAEVLGITVEAVKSRLHRARIAVRERVAPHLAAGGGAAAAPGPGCRDVVEAFSRRLEGEVDASACAELEAHLQGCPTCRGRCDSLRETLGLCRRAGDVPVPPEVAASVREALQRLLSS